jgi:hypothetical protein
MKIGINLVGISYNQILGKKPRNYKDSIDGFYKNVVNPLKQDGHDVVFYLFTHDNPQKENIIKDYMPIKYTFLDENLNKLEGGDVFENVMKIQSLVYINSLQQILNEELDLVISTRFDMNFYKNPFKEYQYDFTKCSFLWREPEFMHLPLVNDTFIVFPHNMTQNLINAIIEMENNPISIGLHNIYLPMIKQLGNEKVCWLDDKFIGKNDSDSRTEHLNTLYKTP